MLTEQDIINNIIVSYDDYYGLNYNQEVLIPICLENGIFTEANTEMLLNMFLFEDFDEEACYLDDKREYVNKTYLKENPHLIIKMIEENKERYL